MPKYESKWRRNQRKIEEDYKNKISTLQNKIADNILEIGLYQNLCLKQRTIFQEIIAICSQEQIGNIDQVEKLKRIEQYARRALASK